MYSKFAIRYLLSPKSHSVINMVGIVSLVAICIPVAAMVILLSVFNGFENLVGELNSAVDSDIEITSAFSESNPLFSPSSDFTERLEDVKGVEKVCSITEGKAFIQRKDIILPVNVRGIDSLYQEVIDINQFMEVGKDLKYIRGAVIGEALRVQLGIYLTADQVQFRTMQGGRVGSVIPFGYSSELNAKVYGFFHIDESNDQQLVLIDKELAKDLFQRENSTSILVSISSPKNINSIKAEIKNLIQDENIIVQTRQERNALAYYVMKMEKWGIFLICLLVLMIASMSIIGLISIMIVEKRDEQLIIKAMGGDSSFIRKIFICEGAVLSWAGGMSGVFLGILVVLAQKYLHLVKLPSAQFLIEDYPVELHFADIIWIILSFTIISLIFSFIAVHKNIER